MTVQLGADLNVDVEVRPREPITQGNPVLVETGAGRLTGDRVCWTWCPGCQAVHQWVVERRPGSVLGTTYGWDGSRTRPTFTPALAWSSIDAAAGGHRCRARLTAGVWEFLDGCTHGLTGQKIPMVPVPDWLRDVT